MLFQIKSPQSFQVKDIDLGQREFVQAFSRFNIKDADKDIVRRGSFNKTWKDNINRIRHFLNHDPWQPVGKPKEFWEDSDYAYMRSKIGTHNLGNDFLKMLESELISEASHGYEVLQYRRLEDGGREITEIKLHEVSSLTSWGANAHTPVIAWSKSADSTENIIKQVERRRRKMEKFCRETTATDETIDMLLLEIKQMDAALIELHERITLAAKEQSADNGQKTTQAPEPNRGSELKQLRLLIEIENQNILN